MPCTLNSGHEKSHGNQCRVGLDRTVLRLGLAHGEVCAYGVASENVSQSTLRVFQCRNPMVKGWNGYSQVLSHVPWRHALGQQLLCRFDLAISHLALPAT